MSDDLEDLEDLIDDLAGDDDDLGAPRSRGRRRQKATNVKQRVRSAFRKALPGGADKVTDIVCPFTEVTFAAAAPGPLTATSTPQKPFIGERFAVDLARTGATATGMVRLVALSVGVDPQTAAIGNVSVGNFAPTAVGTRLKIEAGREGILLSAQYAITVVPGAADTVFVNTTLIGPALD